MKRPITTAWFFSKPGCTPDQQRNAPSTKPMPFQVSWGNFDLNARER